MSTRRVTIGSSVGLHARPASLFSKAAAAAPVKVTITLANDIDPVDAGSVLMVMGLGAAHGDEVIIEADGAGGGGGPGLARRDARLRPRRPRRRRGPAGAGRLRTR